MPSVSNGEPTPERDRMRGRRPFRSGRVALLALLAAATLALPATPAEAQAGVPRQVDTRGAAFEQAGLKALSAGQFESAASAFRDALALEPRNPRLHLGVAAVMYAQRRDGDARTGVRDSVPRSES